MPSRSQPVLQANRYPLVRHRSLLPNGHGRRMQFWRTARVCRRRRRFGATAFMTSRATLIIRFRDSFPDRHGYVLTVPKGRVGITKDICAAAAIRSASLRYPASTGPHRRVTCRDSASISRRAAQAAAGCAYKKNNLRGSGLRPGLFA